MYTEKDYPTKKALVEDFKAGVKIGTYQPGGMFPAQRDGKIVIEGPHYPKPHKFYLQVMVEDGIITKIL